MSAPRWLRSRVADQKARLTESRWRRRGAAIGPQVALPSGSILTSRTAIGHGTRFHGPVTVRGVGPAQVGRYCAIGDNLRIMTSNHDLYGSVNIQVALQHRITGRRGADLAPGVVVEDAVWIGDNCTLMSGIRVGAGAVVGTGAVVTRDVEPYSIVVGVPARPIGTRFASEVVDELLAVRWWQWDEDRMRRHREFFELDMRSATVGQIRQCLGKPSTA